MIVLVISSVCGIIFFSVYILKREHVGFHSLSSSSSRGSWCPSIDRFSSFAFNKICFYVHLSFGCLLLVESVAEINVGGYSTDLKLTYTALNATLWPDRTYYVKEFGSFNICAVLAAFSLITAFTHFIYMTAFETSLFWLLTPFDVVDRLNWSPDSGIPLSIHYRFFEYSITSALMILVIATLFGLRDVFILIGLFFLMMTTMFFGVLQSWDRENEFKAWPHFFGYISYLPAWGVIIAYFALLVRLNDVPDFVWIVLIVEIALFTCFGLVQFFYNAAPKLGLFGLRHSSNNERAEDGFYNLLSLISKTLLVSILYFNFYGLENMET
jgi:hypothetical protein